MMIRPELLLSIYASALEESSVLYCSMPITSGRRFVDWLASHSIVAANIDDTDEALRDDHRRKVIQANREHARHAVRDIRTSTSKIVIDPSELPAIPNWTQHDWHDFWVRVIERFACAVYFVDGWSYSNGCAHEFYVAHRLSLPTYDERGNPLTLSAGISQLRISIADFQEQNQFTDALENTLYLLEALRTTKMDA